MQKLETLSIIIITYNRPQDALELVRNIGQLEGLHLLKEVIVVNNLSTVSYEPVEKEIKVLANVPFKYLVAPENLGVSRGRNYASRYATGDVFVYFDDDILLPDERCLWKILESFKTRLDSERPIGVMSFKVLYASTMQVQVNAFPHKDFRRYQHEKCLLTYYYPGCAHAIVRQAWQDAGGYPEDFFYGMEEYDLSYRLIDKGYCLQYTSDVTVLHKESPLGRTSNETKLRMMWVNKSKVAWRYLPKRYFYSTSIMWSIAYLLKAGFLLKRWAQSYVELEDITRKEKRSMLSETSLIYLGRVKARLCY